MTYIKTKHLPLFSAGRLTGLLVLLPRVEDTRLELDCEDAVEGRTGFTGADGTFSPLSESENTPLDSVPVELTICLFPFLLLLLSRSVIITFEGATLPNDFAVCHSDFEVAAGGTRFVLAFSSTSSSPSCSFHFTQW